MSSIKDIQIKPIHDLITSRIGEIKNLRISISNELGLLLIDFTTKDGSVHRVDADLSSQTISEALDTYLDSLEGEKC